MNSKRFLSLLLLCSGFGAMLNSSHTSFFEADVTFFSVHILMLEKNVLRIERYGLHELNEGDNYLTRKTSNAHCTHVLNLGERGMHVSSVALSASQPSALQVSAYRGKNEVEYAFDWAQLLMTDASQARSAMHATVALKEMDQVFAESQEVKRGRWQASATISWGSSDKHEMNLVFERGIESAVAVVVPNVLCKDAENEIKIMKKNELLLAGLLKRVSGQPAEAEIQAVSTDDAQDAQEEQEVVVRAGKDICSPYINSHVDNQTPCSDGGPCHSWWADCYCSLLAKLAALKEAVCSCCGCC